MEYNYFGFIQDNFSYQRTGVKSHELMDGHHDIKNLKKRKEIFLLSQTDREWRSP